MKKALRKGGLYSLSKKCLLPAKRAFEIRFLPQLCRGKKHFYPSKCAGWRQSRQDVRAAGMFRRKSHFSDFFDGLRPGTEMAPGRFYEFGTLDYSLEIASLSSLIRVSMVAKFSSRS